MVQWIIEFQSERMNKFGQILLVLGLLSLALGHPRKEFEGELN